MLPLLDFDRDYVFTADNIRRIIFDACDDVPHSSDFAIVLGCDTSSSLRRADIAADFYNRGFAEYIIASGGVEREYNGIRRRECDIMRDRLIENRVPERCILSENTSYDTIGNIIMSFCEMYKMKKSESVRTVTVITEPYHMRRSLLIARTYLPPYISVYGHTAGKEIQINAWQSDADLNGKIVNEVKLIKQLIFENRVLNKDVL